MRNKLFLKKYGGRICTAVLALCAPVFTTAQTPSCSSYGNGNAENITYTINGSAAASLAGVSSGDIVQVCFNSSAGSNPTIYSLVSYSASGATFDANTTSANCI